MTVQQLNLKYSLVNRQKHFEIIDFFEANSLAIQNLDEDTDVDTLTSKMCFVSDYAHAIAQNGQSTKAIPFLKDSIRLQERHPTFIENKMESKNYEFLVFELGRALHKIGNINESKTVFEKLIHLAPENEGYQAWIVGTSNHSRNKVLKYIIISFWVWLFVAVLFRDSLEGTIDSLFTVLGLILFSTMIALTTLNYITKRKYRQKITPHNKVYKS